MLNRDPLQRCAEIPLHSSHHLAGVLAGINQVDIVGTEHHAPVNFVVRQFPIMSYRAEVYILAYPVEAEFPVTFLMAVPALKITRVREYFSLASVSAGVAVIGVINLDHRATVIDRLPHKQLRAATSLWP